MAEIKNYTMNQVLKGAFHVCPLARLRDNQRLGCGLLQSSRMASCFTQRVGVREIHGGCMLNLVLR
jgi:hypothetical protein